MFNKLDGIGQYGDVNVRHQILKAAVDHENEINPKADIRMIDYQDLSQHFNDHPEDGRYRLLVHVRGHYLAVDVRQHNGKKSCLILDAANDYRCDTLITPIFVEHDFTPFAAGGMIGDGVENGPYEFDTTNLQKSATGCSMFALDHCVQLAKAADTIYNIEKTEEYDGVFTFTWDCLPPNFVWNAQSLTLLKRYEAANPGRSREVMPNGMTLEDYVKQGTVEGKNQSINIHVFSKAHDDYAQQLVSPVMSQPSPNLQAKQDVLALMDKVIENLEKSTSHGSKMSKDQKLESLKDIRDSYARGSTDDAPLTAATLGRFQATANQQRKFINFGGAARSGTYFKVELTKLRGQYQEKAATKADMKNESSTTHKNAFH
ncbi:MAG: hypothetical protein CK424_05320 [Legionella sp.]|nr:MAG: hypothetical protein CK424_05320 [Legionella sp.]